MSTDQFEGLGTIWTITLWDDGDHSALFATCREIVAAFDQTYSRFKPDSLVRKLSTHLGSTAVPADLVVMLRQYAVLNQLTLGKINPAIGFALEDAGYDASYSFEEKEQMRKTPLFHEAIEIVDDTHIVLQSPVLLDLGALGKGYVVDRVYDFLKSQGTHQFLVDGSGDIRYFSDAQVPIVCGLEHPSDPTLAIGTLSMTEGAFCASGLGRRRWGRRHHYIDPETGESPNTIIATWVSADSASLADGISSALFFVSGDALTEFAFEYARVNVDLEIEKSAGFTADFFGREES